MDTEIVKFNGSDVSAEEVEFEAVREGWSDLKLDDGTRIKLKHVATRVFRLVDKTNDDGTPIYVLEGASILTVYPRKSEAPVLQASPGLSLAESADGGV